jgi:hypothetical protein
LSLRVEAALPFPEVPHMISAISSALVLGLATLMPEKSLADLPAPAAVDIEGFYSCHGKDANREPYSGVVIVARRGDVYVVGWQIESNTSVGVGLREGNVLSVGFRGPEGTTGVCRYAIEIEDGKPILKGSWATAPGDGRSHQETLTFLRKAPTPESD